MKRRAIRPWFSRKRWLFCSLVLSLLLHGSSSGLAQPENKHEEAIQQLNTIAARTQDYEVAVEHWERTSTIIVTLVMAVGVMGIAVSILQGFGTASCKIACVILGGLVGSITLLNTTLFPADHRAFGYSALKARRVLNDLKGLVSSDPKRLSEQVLEARVDKGLRLIKRMEELEEALYRAWAAPVETRAFVARAHAEAVEQLWRRPFLGVGEAKSLTEARATAFTLATTKAAEALAAAWAPGNQDRVDPYAVRPFIEKVVDVASEDVTEEEGLVRYKVVLNLPREFSREYWFPSFGRQSRPEPLSSGDRVLLRVVPTAEGSTGGGAPGDQYLGIELGHVRLVVPERAVSFAIVRPDRNTESQSIDDNGGVRIMTPVGALSPAGNLIFARVGSQAVFRLRRIVESSQRQESLRWPGLRDGDSVNIFSETKILMASRAQVSLGEGSGAAVTIIRVHRIGQSTR